MEEGTNAQPALISSAAQTHLSVHEHAERATERLFG